MSIVTREATVYEEVRTSAPAVPAPAEAVSPAEMAERCERAGVAKARLDAVSLVGLAILAGAFIALGAVFMTTVTTGAAMLPFGLAKLLGGLVFSLGLILVVVAGAELFTGNNLIVMAFMNRRVTLRQLLRNWGLVYLGNFIGAVLVALLVFASQQYKAAGGAVGANALAIAAAKVGLAFGPALALGILCNALVCLAVWLCFSARSTTDKILAIIFPVAAFVAAGFEHSIANMYLITIGLLIKWLDPGFVAGLGGAVNLSRLTLSGFLLGNLLPVTLGNIIGGAGLVGLTYWLIYLRPKRRRAAEAMAAWAQGDGTR